MSEDEASADPELDIDTFEEWLTRVADSRDSSEGAVLDRMMSSYWVLDELEELLESRATGADLDVGSAPDRSSAEEVASSGDPADVPLDELRETVESVLSEADLPTADPSSSPEGGERDADVTRRMDTLGRELASLTWEVDRLADRQDEQAESLAATRERLSEAAARMEEEQEASVAAVESAVRSLTERVEAVEDEQREVRGNLTEDLTHVEEVLRYLVERTNEFDDRLERLDRKLERELDVIREGQTGQQELADLMRSAAEHGIDGATCADCDGRVELGLLVEPRCPHCSSPIVDVTPKTGWFGSATLETAAGPAGPDRSGHSTRRVRGRRDDDGELTPPDVDLDGTDSTREDAPDGGNGTGNSDASDPSPSETTDE
ncbi:hypothetical protein [Halorarum halobium]|uniref:hypothetical protein n=1 Tax=Halorarum halobium TaxID=3075121 RepID=UPI0028AC07F0|nr:hypothetical protein [Halobaculum sp. XH14]